MTEQTQSKAGKGLGIAGLVLGILGVVLFWTPFVGLILAFIGLILAILGFSQANKAGAPKGVIIAGLILSIAGTALGAWSSYGWYKLYTIGKDAIEQGMDQFGKDFESEMKKASEELQQTQDQPKEEEKPTE